ncbi:NAD(P)H-dependent oxidoreductase [Apibacter adventoris]|uniref:NAD(P)H oxidoreductase n=1 Tax=Apibacter adventoris TaxID=1679466 RepID=A0A2S8AED3_9FLAO|nr:NAD(P)H-dependent oxidoreductase [Apibacter adventoris]PQL93444.1 NAD(P)H oxidoreductase [Apibacter adventoris]
MKTLIVIIHPNLKDSIINKRWIDELKKYPQNYVLHDIHQLYPDERIDIQAEQKLLEQYNKIIFQFPFYWFNCPPFFKKWLDEVLAHGWAYGRNSEYKLAGKKVALAITAGINEEDYQATGRYQYTLEQLTVPFEITFKYVRADYKPLFAFYGAEHNGTNSRIDENAHEYITFLQNI